MARNNILPPPFSRNLENVPLFANAPLSNLIDFVIKDLSTYQLAVPSQIQSHPTIDYSTMQ